MTKTNGCDWSRVRNVVAVAILGLYVIASAAQEPKQTQALPFIPSASDTLDREGFVRVINHSTEAGEVRIDAIDDDGESYGPIMLSVGAGEAVHFNSDDLENGNAEKGLSDGAGPGEGDWRLTFSSELDIEVLSYVRTADGFLTTMHDTVPSEGGVHRVVFINPGSNSSQMSRLRLINPGEEAAEVSITGVDDRGESPGSEVTTTIPAGASRTYTAAELESGDEGLEGALGDGTGKWRLTVESSQPLVAMSLLTDPMGYLTNLSTTPGKETGGVHFVHLMPSASDALGRQGFVRVINHSDEAGEVRIDANDDEGGSYGPVMLSVDASAVVHFSSDDLEDGNAAKGLSGGVGSGEGNWRVELSSELDIEVLSYVRTSDGFVTAMHDTVPSEGGRHWVAFFNPGSNSAQVSRLRLINLGEEAAEASVVGVDDRGESPGGEVTTTIPAGASRTFTAAELESGGEGLGGALGDGEGKWRLTVTSAQPLVVMSLLSDPMGYLTNLSTAPGREPQGPSDLLVVSPSVSNSRPVAGAAFTLSATVRNDGGAPSPVTVLRYYRSSDATVTATDRAVGTDAVVGLAASGSASASVELTAPSTPGTYYYGACVDAVAEEVDATNNCSAAVEVNVQESESESGGQPDLIVAPPTVSDDAPAVGATFILSVTVNNAGDGTAPAAMMGYYRSSDETITTSDTPAGADEVAELGGSGSGSKSVELTAPSTPGAYYYGACVDAVTGESDTTNNCSSAVKVNVPVPEPEPEGDPDLSVPAVSAATSPGGTYTDDSFTLSATVRNDGDGDAAATTLRYYRSADATITTSDTEGGTDEVAGLAASGSGSESVELTAPSTAGTYYYGACVDAVTDESDTTNNCSTSRQIDVLDPQRPPDLVVVSPSVSDDGPVAGETFTLSATVRNDGDGDSAATTVRYYRSTDATITTADTEVGTDAVAGLATSASSDESVDVTAPSDAGAYYYGACVDDVAEESDTTNNCSASVRVDVEEPPKYPNLEVGTPTVDDASPETGATFTLSATVSNTGDAQSAATTLRYYRSADATITTSDTAVGTDDVGALSASGTSAESIELTAPSTAGAYYYGACVDAVTGESDTTDNCSSSVEMDVEEPTAPTAPDLIVDYFTITVGPTHTSPGALVELNQRVANVGDAASAATTVRYYRSTDATITTSDTQVSTYAVPELAASSRFFEVHSERLPTAPGTYYYGACVDAVAGESNRANNCSRSVMVTVPEPPEPQPDLVVSASVDDSNLNTDDSFTLSATVSNAGDEQSAASTLRYYRSTDSTISSSDIQVGTDAVGALAASGTSAQSISLTAPATAGTYYYGACVDAVTDESDTTNNCSSSVTIAVEEESSGQPDLRIVAVDAATPLDGVGPGTLIQFSASVRNYGDANSDATTLRYYRSTDATISVSDTEVGTDEVSALIPSRQVSEGIDLHAPLTAGTYYYGACVDAVTNESDTTNNCSGSLDFTVETPQPSTRSVEVTAPQEWAPVGGTVTYTASVLDENGDEVSGYTFSWTSSDTAKATVDSSGVVTALTVGEATITATASATVSATVNARPLARGIGTAASNSQSTLLGTLKMDVVDPVARIELSPSSLSFDAVSEIEGVTATLYDSDENEMSPTYWGWGSANREVATVYSRLWPLLSASVKSIGEGSTTVWLSANGTRQSMSVTVTLPTARVDISPRSLTFNALGDTESVTVRVLDENGDEVEDATFSYFGGSSPCCGPDVHRYDFTVIDIEKVDGGLEITSHGPGTSELEISSTDVESAILGVTVYMEPASVEVSPNTASLAVGETTTLTATIADANGNSIHVNQDDGRGGHVVTWETSDDEVATVEGSSGREDYNVGATATVTAIAAGSATITGRWGGSVRGTATVTVTDSN